MTTDARPPAVARVLERVTQTARAHELFVPGETVMVAVSGGPDSMCMLHSLHRLKRLLKIKLAVFHFDHRLRSDSAVDARYVERAAASLKLPFTMTVADSAPAKGASVEDWAHRARMRALAFAVRDGGATRAAIGHTLDDQAETVLLAVIRGGGLDAIAGLAPSQGPYVRPLLDTTRVEVEAFCRSLRLRPRIDPTNADTRLLRNAVRHEVLPSLAEGVDRSVAATIARTADNLRVDAAYLQDLATRAFEELFEEDHDGFTLPATALASLPGALSSRVVRTALYRVGALVSSDAIEAVVDLAAGRPGRSRQLSGGLAATRDREYVRVSKVRSGA
jgi:tRNA(Ile)-lysidine synthase